MFGALISFANLAGYSSKTREKCCKNCVPASRSKRKLRVHVVFLEIKKFGQF